MDPELEQDVNAEPSTAEEIQDVADGIEDLPEGAAESSPAEDVTKDTLSIVQDVVGKEPEAGSSPEGEETDPNKVGDAGEEVDYENLPFGKHPRFREVLDQRKAAEAKAKEFEEDAMRHRNIENFLVNNGLSAEEAANSLQIMAMAKTNPVEAWNQIKPWVQQLATAAGAIVPAELQARVQAGEITPETAREMAAMQARATSADQVRQFEAQRIERERQQNAHNDIVNSVTAWESERRMRDPNFGAKYEALQREVAFLQMREGRPADVAGVRAQLERAYEAVSGTVAPAPQPAAQAPAAPAKKAVRPVTGGQSAGNARAEIKSTLDIINNVMAKG